MAGEHEINLKTSIPYLRIDDDGALIRQGLAATPNTAAGVALAKQARSYRVDKLTLTGVEIEIDEANDYGSVKLVDLPDSNILILGAIVDLVCTVDGTVITDPEDIDYAIGTLALTSIDFSNSGEKDITPEADVAAAGVMQLASSGTEANLFKAKGTNAVYLNIQAAIATTAIQSFAGSIDLLYVDLGAES